jgi:hypothetical protein
VTGGLILLINNPGGTIYEEVKGNSRL